MTDAGEAGDRRQQQDRRAHAEQQLAGRRGPRAATRPLVNALRTVGAIALLIGVIVFTVRTMRPVYATRGTLGDELRKHAPGVASVIAPGDSSDVDQLMATPKFQEEKRNFYEDVMRLKQVDSARADSIAQYAVREAYVRGISPAIIFGVMLTENAKFVSQAKSNVGAVGLMQVYPKIWLTKEMTALLGHDLATDSTNVKYGVFILSQYFRPRTKNGAVKDQDWATALLHYNGCVKGTNTPRCHTYPAKVKSFVENQATSICDGRGFYECIAKPFIQGLFGGGSKDSSRVAAQAAGRVVQSSGGAIASPAPAAQPAAPSTPAPAAPTASATPSSAAAKAAVATTTKPAAKPPKAGKAPAAKARTASRKAGPGSARSSGRSSARTAESSRPKSAAPSAPKPIDLSKIRVP
jgi:hypothetical protein